MASVALKDGLIDRVFPVARVQGRYSRGGLTTAPHVVRVCGGWVSARTGGVVNAGAGPGIVFVGPCGCRFIGRRRGGWLVPRVRLPPLRRHHRDGFAVSAASS